MKNFRSFYLLAALLVSGTVSAQESDDLYFSVKDREVEMVAKREANAKLNAMTMRETMQDDNMRSKFANPDYQSNANQSSARMPYFKPDYRRDYSFTSLYANNAASNSRFGFLNNMFMSPLSMGMGMMWGNSMMMMGNPYSMYGMGGMYGNSMMYDQYMMNGMYGNSMMMGNPYSMYGNSMMWGNPYSMYGMNSMYGNAMMMGNPYRSMYGMNSMWGNSFGTGMFFGRSCSMNPMVYNNVVSSVNRSAMIGADNSVSRPTSGNDYVNYMKSSTGYGNFANSSAGNSNAYSAVEYKGGTANSYFYGTPSDTGANSGMRSVDYNNGGSYNRNNSTFGSMNGGFGGNRSSSGGGFGGNSSGYGSGGGGGDRSSGGRGGRGN